MISSDIEKSLKKTASVKRLAGKDRYGTNLAILKEADMTGSTLLICSGESFADSLSASSTGLPILLAGSRLTDEQKKYIEAMKPEGFYMIGGTGVVNSSVEKSCRAYGDAVRLAGRNRYTTSAAVARAFYGDRSSSAVLVSGLNFPDGLSGGPLAISLYAPVMLTDNGDFAVSAFYGKDTGLKNAVVMGGKTLIDDSVVDKVID